MHAQIQDIGLVGAIVFLLTFALNKIAGPVAKRYPWTSSLFRGALEFLPNAIAMLVTIVTKRPVTAPMVQPPADPKLRAETLYNAHRASVLISGLTAAEWSSLLPQEQAHWVAVALVETGAAPAFAVSVRPPPLPGVTSALFFALVLLTSCTRDEALRLGVPAADALGAATTAAAEDLRPACQVPMAEARAAKDVEKGKAIAKDCDKPMLTFKAARILHITMRSVILKVAAGGSPLELLALLPDAAKLGAELLAAVKQVNR